MLSTRRLRIDERRPPNCRRPAPLSSLNTPHRCAILRHYKIELKSAKAKAAAASEQDQLELDRLAALTKRLGSERDQARADSLKYNEECNTLRKELADQEDGAGPEDARSCLWPGWQRA